MLNDVFRELKRQSVVFHTELIDDLLNYLDAENGGFSEIPEDFFDRLAEAINELEEKYKAGELDPRGEDLLRTLRLLRRRLFEKRFSRLVRLAMAQVLGCNVELKGYRTSKEVEFYEKLVSFLSEFKREVLREG